MTLREADLLIQASLGILANSISHRDCILIVNLSSATTTFVWRRLVFPSNTHSSLPDVSHSFSLSFYSSKRLSLSLFSFISLSLCFLLSASLSFTHALLSLCPLSPSLSSVGRRAGSFANKNNAKTRWRDRSARTNIMTARDFILRLAPIFLRVYDVVRESMMHE